VQKNDDISYDKAFSSGLRGHRTQWFDYIQGVPLQMGFIVKNPSKRSVSLKNGLEEKKVKFNVIYFYFKHV
jgi:hypothetical protein